MTERQELSPEQQQASRQIAGFFGKAEREYPAAVDKLATVVVGLIGEQQLSQKKLQRGMGNIDVGLALVGDWLKEVGADGFEVKLGSGDGIKKAIGKRAVKFPNKSDLVRVSGRVKSGLLEQQIPPLLSLFSRQIREALDVGLSPRQIVGGLLAESVGSGLSKHESVNLRGALSKQLGGHLEWIREALEIPDVAEQSGLEPVTAAETTPAAVPKSLPEASRAARQEKPVEAVLSHEEEIFVARLERIVDLDHSGSAVDAGELRKHFEGMKSDFASLPVGGRMRAAVMEKVTGEMAAAAERLKAAGKTDEQIFEEWLKLWVFTPLHRKSVKKKS